MRTSTLLAGYLDFPYVQQVIRIERTTWDLGSTATAEPVFHEVSFYLSDLKPEQAALRRGRLPRQGSARQRAESVAQANNACLGEFIRGHWEIESHHWIRDRAFREDESQVRRGAGPQVMASLRNCAISLMRRLQVPNIAAALRHLDRHPECVCAILGV